MRLCLTCCLPKVWSSLCSRVRSPSVQVIQAVFFGICVLTDLSSLLTKGNDSQEQERQLKKLISLRDWVMAVLAFPVGVVSTVLICTCLYKLSEPCYLLIVFWLTHVYTKDYAEREK